MMKGQGNTSWFDSLRREAKLFAAVGFFSLLMGLLQPLTATAAGPVSYGFIICTSYGIGTASGESRQQSRGADCPLCLSGHACGFQISSAAIPFSAFVPPVRHENGANVSCWNKRGHPTPAGNTAHAIRAPPAPA